MDYFIIRNKQMPWGDYGNVLFRGFLNVMDKNYNDLDIPEIERTGPYIPDIYITNTRDLVISNKVKELFDEAQIKGVDFYKPIKLKKIVKLDWNKWDLNSSDPEFIPSSGKPEDYIIKGKDNDDLKKEIPLLWNPILKEEKVLKVISEKRDLENFSHLEMSEKVNVDILCSLPRIIVSEKLKNILEDNKIESLRFIKINNGGNE